jgi:hypothetical protein
MGVTRSPRRSHAADGNDLLDFPDTLRNHEGDGFVFQEIGLNEADITRTAQHLVGRYGSQAAIRASMRAEALLRAGQADGSEIWTRIARAIAGADEYDCAASSYPSAA